MILVSGIKDSTDKVLVKMFFESKRRTGGGPVKDIDYRDKDGLAVITFYSAEGRHNIIYTY